MSKTKYIIIFINLLLLLGYFNWSIVAKEKTLSAGKRVLLELKPVDPRSIMQGDYMSLAYKIDDLPPHANITKRGYCIVKVDAHGVGQKLRLQNELKPLAPGEMAIKYFFSGNSYFANIHLGAEAYFFQEGQGKRFEAARYGALKVDDAGNSVLEGLYNEQYRLIK
ncbi:GDYXXLXY domain-containing protein [Mucilaginibacter psychrotolerans]|uniref:GDYXXLXY domain-containing protein n=1 Tax=Mucilaginibacter psychrotolerans TaxID=1524096 RepID=A0A4Y8SIF6_9SPHI|nr:GDYXXLXY domain-containing protein [Mucilaginibacter psychrotolerans]TFF38196.1 hypothetical protein E2R66_09165 [Mucilaginibacter psychrotolerans]